MASLTISKSGACWQIISTVQCVKVEGITGKCNVIQIACPLKAKPPFLQGIAPMEVNPVPWPPMLIKLYDQEWSSSFHKRYPTIIVSDIVLPIWLELPSFTVEIKILFTKSLLGSFFDKARYDKVPMITSGMPEKRARLRKHHSCVLCLQLYLNLNAT